MKFTTDAARTRPVVVVDKKLCWGVAEDADIDIQPITRADFVPAKVFRSRSMNTPAAGHKCKSTVEKRVGQITAMCDPKKLLGPTVAQNLIG